MTCGLCRSLLSVIPSKGLRQLCRAQYLEKNLSAGYKMLLISLWPG